MWTCRDTVKHKAELLFCAWNIPVNPFLSSHLSKTNNARNCSERSMKEADCRAANNDIKENVPRMDSI